MSFFSSSLLFLLITVVYMTAGETQVETFRFANYFGDNMVLQRAPASPTIWGYVPTCDTVTVSIMKQKLTANVVKGADGMCRFYVKIPSMQAGGSYTITAVSQSGGSITLNNIIFGDVWVCGGQSNMVFTLPQAFNATEEMAKADNYPEIRLFTVQRVSSATPLDEPPVILQPWSVASSKTVNGGAWQYFSAVCWFYGKNIYDKMKVPLGLVSSNWGGTKVEAWSSPDALKQCSSQSPPSFDDKETHDVKAGPNPNENSVLWNAMMRPLLNMTIYGAIWYQGEANAGNPTAYSCSFPAMINDWRQKWNEATNGDTDITFPFGFVQLSAVGTNNQSEAGFAGIRWAQTANYGYVPNDVMKKVFMAVAMDLGDPTSPFGSVHPRDKETVGYRLALAGRAIAYGETDLYYTGPIVEKYDPNMGLSFRNINDHLDLHSVDGFEIGCTQGSTTKWLAGTGQLIADRTHIELFLPSCPEGYKETGVRYGWMEDPCPYLKCAIYSGDLPSPPFTLPIKTENRK